MTVDATTGAEVVALPFGLCALLLSRTDVGNRPPPTEDPESGRLRRRALGAARSRAARPEYLKAEAREARSGTER
jgi:hypothetical protein